MPTREQHRLQAKDNEDLCRRLVGSRRHLDWAVTALFYSALHYVDAALHPVHPRNHAQRNHLLSRHPELRPVFPQYRLLYQRSLKTRYECVDPSTDEVRGLRRVVFQVLVTHVEGLLGA